MHRPYDDLAGFDAEELHVEGQVAIVPAAHPLAARDQLALADVQHVPDLPIARWPRLDGSYPDGPGPEVRTQSQLAQWWRSAGRCWSSRLPAEHGSGRSTWRCPSSTRRTSRP